MKFWVFQGNSERKSRVSKIVLTRYCSVRGFSIRRSHRVATVAIASREQRPQPPARAPLLLLPPSPVRSEGYAGELLGCYRVLLGVLGFLCFFFLCMVE